MALVLLVEDEAHIAEAIQFNLEAEGHEVAWVATGRAAIERLGVDPPVDLVILDLMLPEMGGFEVARRARATGNYVPILIVTAKDDAQDRVRGIEEGADDYLTKPFSLDELLARVRALLRRRRWDGVAPDAAPPRSELIGRVTVHFDRFELETPEGTVRLTTREAGLLRERLEQRRHAADAFVIEIGHGVGAIEPHGGARAEEK